MQGNIIAECRLACKDVDVDVSVCKSPWQETLDAMPDICSSAAKVLRGIQSQNGLEVFCLAS